MSSFECSCPESVASQMPTASSSVEGSREGIETKTDGTYSGIACLLTSFTSSAAMEALDVGDARSETVGLAADFSPSWTSCACAHHSFSPHMLSQCKDSTILTISIQLGRRPPNTGTLLDNMLLPVHNYQACKVSVLNSLVFLQQFLFRVCIICLLIFIS